MVHIPHQVREPLAGFMRYAWWREALDAMQQGQAAPGHPLLQALHPWLIAHPAAYASLQAIIETGQHLLEDAEDAQHHARRELVLDTLWRMELGPEHPAPLEILATLPVGKPLGLAAILRVFRHGLRS